MPSKGGKIDKRAGQPAEAKESPPLGRKVAEGQYGDVWLSDETAALFDALCSRTDETSIRESTSLERYFQRFAEMGPSSMHEKMFKALGRKKDRNGRPVQVVEMKAYQYRIYGVVRHYRGRPCFIGLSTDEAKKTDRADPRLIERAAERSSEWD